MQTWISPSILAADFSRLGDEVRAVLDAGADTIHFDVMDNHYVPNLTIGPLVLESLRKAKITAPVDVHLMVKPVDRLVEDFAAAGADYITVHPRINRTPPPHAVFNSRFRCEGRLGIQSRHPASGTCRSH